VPAYHRRHFTQSVCLWTFQLSVRGPKCTFPPSIFTTSFSHTHLTTFQTLEGFPLSIYKALPHNVVRWCIRFQFSLVFVSLNNEYSGICYNEQFSTIKSGCYNKHRRYNERMLQRTVFINKIRMLQRTQMLQWTNATTNSFHR
jgi:hypothetical protein